MNAADFATPLAAFVAGMVTSVHCAVMCGPLGCALFGAKPGTPREMRQAVCSYHAMRLLSYSVVGATLGALGGAAAGVFHTSFSRLLPWAMAAFFVVLAFGWERYLPRLPLVSRWLFKMNLRATLLPRSTAAALLGAATPFLPCGPLYLAFGATLVSGSWIAGATLMAAFALGTMPLYALLQIGAWRWQGAMTPAVQNWTRRVLALGSAALIGGRALTHNGSLLEPIRCLLCH